MVLAVATSAEASALAASQRPPTSISAAVSLSMLPSEGPSFAGRSRSAAFLPPSSPSLPAVSRTVWMSAMTGSRPAASSLRCNSLICSRVLSSPLKVSPISAMRVFSCEISASMPTKRLAAVSEFLAASLAKSASYLENLLRIGTSAFFFASLSSAPARIA
ncbi:hypothetical protein D9M70_514450 [compost metagenome]